MLFNTKWIAVLDAIEQLQIRHRVPTSQNMPADMITLQQMIGARLIFGTPNRLGRLRGVDRVGLIGLTKSGKILLEEFKRQQRSHQICDSSRLRH